MSPGGRVEILRNDIGIPGSFTLMGEKWEVVFEDNPSNGDHLGYMNAAENKIVIQTTHLGKPIPANKMEATFYHELMHAILEMGGYEKLNQNEKLACLLGGCLHQFLQTADYKGVKIEDKP